MNWKKMFPKENRYFETENGILYNGDAIKILEKFSKESVDLIITSPPYDNLRTYDNKVKWDFEIFKQLAQQLVKVLKKRGVIVWVVGDATIKGSETGTSFKQVLYFKEQLKMNIHDTMIYEKTGFNFPSKTRYHQIFEYMFIFSKGKPKTFNPIKDKKIKWGKPWGKATNRNKEGKLTKQKDRKSISEYGMRYNIWRIKNGKGFGQKDEIAYKHPATFPEQLAHDHIISWSNAEEIIIDPLAGSGTTLKMAEKLNRKWIGIEINEEYCEIAKQRLMGVK